MSFICGICKKAAPAGTRSTYIKVQTKEVSHPFRPSAQKKKGEEGKPLYIADEGGKGIQTVREVQVCINCAPSAKAAAGT